MAPANAKKVSGHIHDDLAISILSKLPLKSLKRFTCAQKSWSLFLDNLHFMTMFRKSFIVAHCSLYDDTCVLLKQMVPVSVPTPGQFALFLLYLLDGEKFENKVKLESPRRFQWEDTREWPVHVCVCVNGIIYLRDINNKSGTLWNPATNECIYIPRSPFQFPASNTTLASPYGFGYDHVRDDYKVIRCVSIVQQVEVGGPLTYVPTESGPLWEIYSLRSDSWRKLDVNVPTPYILGCSVYLNGMCHWLGKCVLSFNLCSEVFVTTPLPSDMHDDDGDLKLAKRRLVELNGSITVISKYSTTASFHISILGEVGVVESWVKLFIVGPLPFIDQPIGVGKNGEIFFGTKDYELVCFDLSTQTFKEVGLKGVAVWQTTIYKTNLFPIRGKKINNCLCNLIQEVYGYG